MKKHGRIEEHLKYLFTIALECKGTALESSSIKTIKLLSQKYQIRLSQDIKRNICFNCNCFLVPSFSCLSRIVKSQNGVSMEIVCSCTKKKNYFFRNQKGKRKERKMSN